MDKTPSNLVLNVDYLIQYKKSKCLTNKELADIIGVHESTISRILRKKKGVGRKFIFGILYKLKDIDLTQLFINDETKEKVG